MIKNKTPILFVLVLSALAVKSQNVDTVTIMKGRELRFKHEEFVEAGKRVPSKRGARNRLLNRRDVSDMATVFGLDKWINVEPSAPFIAYWFEKQPTELRLQIEFASLAVVLNAAKTAGLNAEADQIYSAPAPILSAVQKERSLRDQIRLVDVPELGNLSRAEAENELVEHRLVPEAIPQYAKGVTAHRVIPDSQNPAAKLSVKPGTVIRFGVSLQTDVAPPAPRAGSSPAITIAVLTSGKTTCNRGGDNIYRCEIKGKSTGLNEGYGVLLWVRPVRPPSDTPGWYLQRPPANGVAAVEADGSWTGVVQLGSSLWPPHDGDTFDVAASVADSETVRKLMAESGVVLRNYPLGIKSAKAAGLIAELR